MSCKTIQEIFSLDRISSLWRLHSYFFDSRSLNSFKFIVSNYSDKCIFGPPRKSGLTPKSIVALEWQYSVWLLLQNFLELTYYSLKVSEPKWFNSILNITGVNSLRLEGLYITVGLMWIISLLFLIEVIEGSSVYWSYWMLQIWNHDIYEKCQFSNCFSQARLRY